MHENQAKVRIGPGSGKTMRSNWIASGVVSMLAFVVGVYLISSPTCLVTDMWPHGRLLLLLPIVLAPVHLLLVAKALGKGEAQSRERGRATYVFLSIVAVILPFITIVLLNALLIGFVEIPRQGLSESELQKIESLRLNREAFPFRVRFLWRKEKIRVAFATGEMRRQIVENRLKSELSTQGKQ